MPFINSVAFITQYRLSVARRQSRVVRAWAEHCHSSSSALPTVCYTKPGWKLWWSKTAVASSPLTFRSVALQSYSAGRAIINGNSICYLLYKTISSHESSPLRYAFVAGCTHLQPRRWSVFCQSFAWNAPSAAFSLQRMVSLVGWRRYYHELLY